MRSGLMSYHAAFSLLLIISLSFKLCNCARNTTVFCLATEEQSLLTFKKSLQDPRQQLSSWDADVDCCKWKGVVCNNLTGRVHELHLPQKDLRGKIDPSLLKLKHLAFLDLSKNFFAAKIPSFIGSFTALKHLNLSNASFYGKIPHSIGNLSSLTFLDLSSNSFDSSLDLRWIFQLNNLVYLDLSGNPFEGSISGVISNLTSLEVLDLSLTQFDVDSLEWLLELPELEYFYMNGVNLSKAVNWPKVISSHPSLLEHHLQGCNLEFFPAMDIDANTTSSLLFLDLSSDNFQSTSVLRWIFQLNNLLYLNLSRNSFDGPIPSTSNATKLKGLDLSVNHFNSSIPDWIYLCRDMWFVSLRNNLLHGAISNAISNLTSLEVLDVSLNKLSGRIPTEISRDCKLQVLSLYNNQLEGEVADSFGNMSECFSEALIYLLLNNNKLSGNLADELGKFKNLEYLTLSYNSFSGSIPSSLGTLSSLQVLTLQGNKLTGNLPESLGQLYNLERLYISHNKLEGTVTESFFANLTN